MRTMKILGAAMLLCLGLGACSEAGKWQSRYQKIVDEGCACKDSACFDKVSDERRTMRKEFKEKYKDDKEKAKKIADGLNTLDDKWNACRDKLEKPVPTP